MVMMHSGEQTLQTSRETEVDCRAGYGSRYLYYRCLYKNLTSKLRKYLQTVHWGFKCIEYYDWIIAYYLKSIPLEVSQRTNIKSILKISQRFPSNLLFQDIPGLTVGQIYIKSNLLYEFVITTIRF